VIVDNLKRSFPNFTEKELSQITQRYYWHFAQIMVEMIKMLSISKASVLKRYKITNPEILNPYFEKNQSVILASSHYNNWEWMILSLQLQIQHSAIGVGKRNTNSSFEDLVNRYRTRYGTQVIFTDVIKNYIEQDSGSQTLALMMLADQSPSLKKKSYICSFLNQETHFLYGPEYLAKKHKFPVFYYFVRKRKRGYYEVDIKLISDTPCDTEYGDITRRYVQCLESQIYENPVYWLWSHRRWKHPAQKIIS
jgi:KDO2-lipid IV(A) lauroyltransferase